MKYGYTTLGTNWNEDEFNTISIRFIKALLFFIPRANPDNEKLYPQVKKWFLEIDEYGIPNREIGIDKNNLPLFSAPNDRNYGLWPDSNEKFDISELEQSNKEAFEAMWEQVEKNA